MDFHEKLLLVLYAAIAVYIAVEFFDLWNLSIVLFGIIVISIVQKISTEKKIKNMENTRSGIIEIISQKIDIFSGSVDLLKRDFSRNIEFLDNKINVVNNIYETEMKKGYAEISSRISSFEDRLESIRESINAINRSTESRLSELENRNREREFGA